MICSDLGPNVCGSIPENDRLLVESTSCKKTKTIAFPYVQHKGEQCTGSVPWFEPSMSAMPVLCFRVYSVHVSDAMELCCPMHSINVSNIIVVLPNVHHQCEQCHSCVPRCTASLWAMWYQCCPKYNNHQNNAIVVLPNVHQCEQCHNCVPECTASMWAMS